MNQSFSKITAKTPKKSYSAAKHNSSSIFKQSQTTHKYNRDPQYFGKSDAVGLNDNLSA